MALGYWNYCTCNIGNPWQFPCRVHHGSSWTTTTTMYPSRWVRCRGRHCAHRLDTCYA